MTLHHGVGRLDRIVSVCESHILGLISTSSIFLPLILSNPALSRGSFPRSEDLAIGPGLNSDRNRGCLYKNWLFAEGHSCVFPTIVDRFDHTN